MPAAFAKHNLKILKILKFYWIGKNIRCNLAGLGASHSMETTEIYADLQRRLITGAFQPGCKLKPAELQGLYGRSANTVRDVLLRLSNIGLVEFENQRGFRVADVSRARLADITRFRIILEREGASLSMQHGGVAWESQLTAAHHKLKHIETRLNDGESIEALINLWSDAELGFHETLISACGSRVLRETHAQIYVQFRQQLVSIQPDFSYEQFQRIVKEHQAILDAALARNAEACRKAISKHLSWHVHADDISSVK